MPSETQANNQAKSQADNQTPILVGAGQAIDRPRTLKEACAPIDLLLKAARGALKDTGAAQRVMGELDAVAGLRFISDSPEARALPFAKYPNPGLSIARALGIEVRDSFYFPSGGNTPQAAVNFLAEQIAEGACRAVLLVGGECWGSVMRALAEGPPYPNWNDDPQGPKTLIGEEKPGTSPTEYAHGFLHPVNTYPLLENAWRGQAGRTMAAHQKALGALMAPFSKVAAQHKLAWFPTARSADEISTPSVANRWVGFPYTKYMNAVMKINQAGAVILTSVGAARAMGIDESQWVYLHGCAEANEIWHVSERPQLHRSQAIARMGERALAMAGWRMEEMEYLDIYSCFPIAVEVACKELGLALDDARGLTVTGGLPYFGGAGNAYTLMALVTMMAKLRARPGSKGLLTGNGWYLTKHAMGLYSTAPTHGRWEREPPRRLQAELDRLPRCRVLERPEGEAVIDTYTIVHLPNKTRLGIVIGRMAANGSADSADDESAERFVAHLPAEEELLTAMMKDDYLGRRGIVRPQAKGRNLFVPQV